MKEEDITLNVIQSLKQDEARKTKMIENNVYSGNIYYIYHFFFFLHLYNNDYYYYNYYKVLKPFFRKFGAVSGSRIY